MIKNFKSCVVPEVELGNLTVENCSLIYVAKLKEDYPIAWFAKGKGKGFLHIQFPGHPISCPKGYQIRQQFDTPEEALLDYADWIKRDHEGLSDERMLESGSFPFAGFKRNSRWHDEMLRRKLIKK